MAGIIYGRWLYRFGCCICKTAEKRPKTIQKYLSIYGSYAMIEKLKNHVC